MPTDAEKYVKVLRGDALDCLRNLTFLNEMEAARQTAGVSGYHQSAALFNHVARNAQIVAMISLARLFDRGKDVISLVRARSNQNVKQPANARDLWRQIDQGVIDNLREWRDITLAHSLESQTQFKIDEAFPLTPNQIEEVLHICIDLINQYSELNRTGKVFHKISWEREFSDEAEGVPNMVAGIFREP